MLKEGQKFGDKERYELVRLLGRGGFSEVWLANDDWTHIQVAIKVYAPGTGLDEAGIEVFTQEFSQVFDMNHTNLLKPTYFDNWERQPFLIMPLCKNGSAFKYVTGKVRITEEECWNLLHDVAAGLAYLHAKEPPLIHQDIKPDNILISDEGRYMITDFGISARVRSTMRSGSAQEQSGGTLAYMGPERFSATPKPIMASDVWSLGAMMFELMCGNPPFGNHGGMLQKNGADIPLIEENYSQELKDMVYSCLAKDTWNRPSAKAIEEMTYNHLHGINVSTIPLTAAGGDTLPQTAPSQEAKPEPKLAKQPQEPKLEPKPVEAPKPAGGKKKEQHQQKAQKSQQPQYSPKPQQPQSPQAPRPIPAAKKSAGIVEKFNALPKNTKLGIGIGVAVLLLILGLVSFCGGDKEQAVAETTENALPTANLDSIAQSKLLIANEYAKKAAEFQDTYKEELLNPENGKIEEQYIAVIDKCREYEVEAAAAPGSTLADMSLGEQLNALKTDAENQLLTIYAMLQEDIRDFMSIGSKESADLYQERANAIRPYIEAKLPPEPEEQTNTEEQTETQELTEE